MSDSLCVCVMKLWKHLRAKNFVLIKCCLKKQFLWLVLKLLPICLIAWLLVVFGVTENNFSLILHVNKPGEHSLFFGGYIGDLFALISIRKRMCATTDGNQDLGPSTESRKRRHHSLHWRLQFEAIWKFWKLSQKFSRDWLLMGNVLYELCPIVGLQTNFQESCKLSVLH